VLAEGVLVGFDMTTRIPPGAQQVHLASTGTEVRLDPPSVRAGDVWIYSVDPVPVPLRGEAATNRPLARLHATIALDARGRPVDAGLRRRTRCGGGS